MKLKSLLTAFLVMLTTFATAQVQDGKVYRVVSGKYGTVLSESPILHTLSCASEGGAADYHEMWKFTAADNGKFTIQNVYTQRYVQYKEGKNEVWNTGNSKTQFTVTENATLKGYYNIDIAPTKNWGMHCDGSSNIVPWSYGPEGGEVTGTEWVFEEVDITEEEVEAAYAAYQNYATIIEESATISATVENLFEDNACTVLKAEYKAMSDNELVAAMPGVPADLQQAVLKIKNAAWDTTTREQEFRVYDYKPYSDPETWYDILYTRLYSPIDNPTGICANDSKSFLYVFVDEIPEGTYVHLREVSGTYFFGNDTQLEEGLNIVPCAQKDGVFYIRYICDTHTGFDGPAKTGPKKLADYPAVKVHIEGGYVNGFWSKERGHTNEDWIYMQQHMFKNPSAIQAKGDFTLLSFRKAEFIQPQNQWGMGCPEKITELISLWDFWNKTQQKYMALDKYYDYFNNLQLAMSDDTGFMDAGNHRTHYNNNTLNTICNYDLLLADAGSTWGPNHEIGHNNQYVYEIVGTSEVSNNGFANFVTFEQGTHTSRGNNMDDQIIDFENKVPYVLRGEKMYGSKLFSMTRMYFQLFLYAHAAGKCPDFYPRLHEKLRYDRLVGWSVGSWDEMDENGFYKNSVNALNDQLKFAEACCEILQMDLSEFFEAWGFFIPFKNGFVGDYGHHWVYLLEEDVKASKERMQQYEKKGGHLMFLEDRIRQSPRKESPFCDGTGYRQNYADWEGQRIGEVGDFGQWMDYIDESVKAQGYYYAVAKGKVVIKEAENAGGALGFKLYDADTKELLTFTNRKEMTIPERAMNANLEVHAAQADGTDYIVPHAKNGPESMQKEALSGSLNMVAQLLNRKAKNSGIVGYYKPEAVADLEALYKEAKAANDNNDTSKYSFAEWSIMLDDERNKVISDENSRYLMKENALFTMMSPKSARGYYALGGYPVATSSTKKEDNAVWVIEYSGTPGEYFLKNQGSSYYVTIVGMNNNVYLESKKQSDAIKFRINYTSDGFVQLITVDNEEIAFGINGSAQVVGASVTDDASKWQVIISEDNSAEFYKSTLDELTTEANIKITEILNLDSLQTMNIFNSNIVVVDNNLNTYALNLLSTYYEVTDEKINEATEIQVQKYVDTLRKQIKALDGKYIVTAPIATKGERVVWYYVIGKKADLLASIFQGTNSFRKNGIVLSDEANDYALWSFASTGKAGEYKVYNAGNNGFISKNKTKLQVVSTEDVLPVTISFDNEKGLMLIADESYLYDAGSADATVSLAASPSYWELQIALIEENKEIADIITTIESVIPEANGNRAIYDLSGRRVEKPTRGIFIQGGKKVLVK